MSSTVRSNIIGTSFIRLRLALVVASTFVVTACAPLAVQSNATTGTSNTTGAAVVNPITNVETVSVPAAQTTVTSLTMNNAPLANRVSTDSQAPRMMTVTLPADPMADRFDIGEIQRMPFRAGVSSITVERMARERGCNGGRGAGLLTEDGPVEVYRMVCDTGAVFMARCELRQCRPMR